MRSLQYIEAIVEAIDEEMARDDSVFVIGEDVGYFGSVWGACKGLIEKYGEKRLRDTPITESGIIGTAVGAAMTGLRPVVEIMYNDFITCGMDQLVNQAAKLRLMSGNNLTIPLVVRMPEGCGTAEAAQHSQNLEAWFVHTPGLKVVAPATVYDMKGLLKTAIRDNNPVVLFENRRLYNIEEQVLEGEWLVPFGEAVVRCRGDDLTIVSYSYMMHEALQAAEELADQISIEVIDLRTLVPLDLETIISSVRKTGRLLIVHEAVTRCSVGSDIAQMVTEHAFDYLDAPPQVLGSLNIPSPYSPVLENECIPTKDKVIAACRAIIS